MSRRILLIPALAALFLPVLSAQAPMQQPPSTKGVVIKGKAPVSDQVLQVKLPRPQEADLSNGVHVLLIEDHRLPQVSMRLDMRGAGGYFDPAAQAGVAQVTATLLSEGTKTRTSQQIAVQLETLAASVGASAGMFSDTAMITASSLTENLDAVMDLWADVLLNPTFPAEELARYKTRTQGSLMQQRSNPGFLAQEMFSRVVYGDHPASRVSLTPASLNAITRDAIVAFHAERYVPDHAVIGIVGDVTMADAKAKLEARLAGWKKKGAPRPELKDPAAIGPARVMLVDRANSVQTNFAVGTQSIPRTSADYDVLSLVDSIIGGGPTGRLFLNLREDKGFTYGAYSRLGTPRYRGDWVATTSVRTDVTDAALTEIMREIARTRDEPVPDKEFQDKKRSLVASFALSLESPSSILGNYITSWMYGFPADYWDKYPERIMAISKDQVQATAKKYLDPARLQIVAVGDGKKIAEGLKKFGKVEVFDTEGKPVAQGQ